MPVKKLTRIPSAQQRVLRFLLGPADAFVVGRAQPSTLQAMECAGLIQRYVGDGERHWQTYVPYYFATERGRAAYKASPTGESNGR